MLNFLTRIFSWITDPKNRNLVMLIGIGILIALLLRQCNATAHYKDEVERQKEETTRLLNNEEAKNAQLIQYIKDDSITRRAMIQGFELTQEELKKDYADLLDGFEDLKKKTALALAKGTIHTKETIYVYTTAKIDSLGNGEFYASDTLKVDDDNWRIMSFRTPFTNRYFNKSDSTEVDFSKYNIFQELYPGQTQFTFEQSIGLKVGLFKDPNDKKIYIAAESKYPGLTFTKLEGADIMADPESRKVTRDFRKPFGISIQGGYGVMVNALNGGFATGPYIGIGLHYSPKWLQWGK